MEKKAKTMALNTNTEDLVSGSEEEVEEEEEKENDQEGLPISPKKPVEIMKAKRVKILTQEEYDEILSYKILYFAFIHKSS